MRLTRQEHILKKLVVACQTIVIATKQNVINMRLIIEGGRYEIHGKQERLGWHDSFHGDIYTHEVRVGDAGGVVHEILFASDSTIEIECVDFRVDDEIHEQKQG